MIDIKKIQNKLKKDTNEILDITYRTMKKNNKDILIIYSESLTSSDKISDFIIRSLNHLKSNNLYEDIKNNLDNFKILEIKSYDEMCFYINSGYTIILINNEENILALETKGNLSRSISVSDTEATLRGSKDSFVEELQKNTGLIKKRIKSNNLRINNVKIGKFTKTMVNVFYLNNKTDKKLLKNVMKKINEVNLESLINADQLKNSFEKNTLFPLPTILTSERPDIVSNAILNGKVVIMVDNSPYALIIPGLFIDYFKTPEDFYTKNINTTFVRLIRYLAFFISITTPALYLAFITYNQEIIPTELLISFATQRDGVPFPAFFEAFIMIIAFDLLRESDIRVPAFTGSALSIVGALILGDAAVAAGIVSPIMIIVIAITAICSLPFNEPDMINGLRWYRLLFMILASMMGLIGVLIGMLIFIIDLVSNDSFGVPYFTTYAPFSLKGIRDSIIKITGKNINLSKGNTYEEK